ncbi:MAG: hypothetical protein ACRDNM_07525, partial [Gaiellaceae bacterium]
MLGRAALAVALGFLAAGCGGASKAPSVASLDTTPSTPGSTTREKASFPAFVACMQEHGIQAQSPGGHGLEIQGTPDNGRVQAAMAACQKLMPGGGPPPLTPAQEARRAKALATLAACMRKHGVVSFPDPAGDGEFPIGALDKFSPESPVF